MQSHTLPLFHSVSTAKKDTIFLNRTQSYVATAWAALSTRAPYDRAGENYDS